MKRMVWEPVEDGTECFTWGDDDMVVLEPGYTVCRLVETDVPSVPVEVREAIELMKTVLAIDIAAGAYTYLEIGPQLKDAVSKVGAWLDTLSQDGEP